MATLLQFGLACLVEQFNRLNRLVREFFDENGVLDAINAAIATLTANDRYLLNSNSEFEVRILDLEQHLNVTILRLSRAEEKLRLLAERNLHLESNLAGNVIGLQEKCDSILRGLENLRE